MGRFLPALLFTICVVATAGQADSFPCTHSQPPNCPSLTYDSTETVTVATPTAETFVLTFQKETPNPPPALGYSLDHGTGPSLAFPLGTESLLSPCYFFSPSTSNSFGTPDGLVPFRNFLDLVGMNLIATRCFPDCHVGQTSSSDITFFPDSLAEAPVSTPEPAGFVLLGTGILGRIARKLA
jgi:hypothetical protein